MSDQKDYVPLLEMLDAVRKHYSIEDEAAQDIIVKAHRLGDLDLRVRRPDGSVDEKWDRDYWQSVPHYGETWRLLFDRNRDGVIDLPQRIPPQLLRRRRLASRRFDSSTESCRICGIRQNLNSFLEIPELTSKSPGPTPGKNRQYDAADRALFDEVQRLMGKGLSLTAATEKLANDRQVAGNGTPENCARRVARLYRAEREG